MKPRRKDVPELFKWRHFEPEIILLCVRWYLSYRLSYRKARTSTIIKTTQVMAKG